MPKDKYKCYDPLCNLHVTPETNATMSREADRLEQMLIHCHMALIGIWPASDAWGEVNEWLAKNGKSPYSKKVLPLKRN